MQALLIDDRGEVWPACPETVARRFRATQGQDFHLHAIAHGFIFVRFNACGAQIGLRPQFASRAALARLFGIVSQRNPTRVAVAHDARLASWELVCGTHRAIARIEQIIADARSPSPRPLLTVQPLPLERCAKVGGGRLLPILQAWQQRQGRWEADFYGRLLEWKLMPVTVITQRACGSERLIITHWGSRITAFGKDWPRIAPGRDIEDQPNLEIGRWRGAELRRRIAEGVPRLLALDLVFRPVDRGLVRLQYFRIELPWRKPDGAALLTGSNVARRLLVLEPTNPPN